MTTGEPLVVRVAMKPISTLMRPLGTVDVATGEAAAATAERSDVTAVPAMGVIAEAMLAFVLADAMLEKFGGDSLAEIQAEPRWLPFAHRSPARRLIRPFRTSSSSACPGRGRARSAPRSPRELGPHASSTSTPRSSGARG